MRTQNKTKIAIIGFGFSGLMSLRHLIAQNDITYEIHVYDEKRMWAKGLAYSTQNPQHLLNVRASRMGAFADNPEDFLRWLSANRVKWRMLHEDFAGVDYHADSYVPRMIYGAYLEDILTATQEIAAHNGHHLYLHDGKVRHITPDLRFITETEENHVDKLILTAGHFGERELPASADCRQHSALLHAPWNPTAAKAFRLHYRSRTWDAQSHIAVLGTALSAIDMLHSLHQLDYPGKVTAISRHGNLPEMHAPSQLVIPNFSDIQEYPVTAKELYSRLYEEILAHGENWRGYVDGLRPYTNFIWQRLPDAEKEFFINNYLHWWGIKRHRMSADSSALVQDWLQAGKLAVTTANLMHIHHDGAAFTLELGDAGALQADAVINASGYCYRPDPARGGVISQLLQQRIIRSSALGIGIATDSEYRAAENIYAMGPLLFGTRIETTAIAELRQQAQELAEVIHQDVRAATANYYYIQDNLPHISD